MAKNEEDMPLTMASSEPPREGYEQYMLRRMREEGRKDRLRKATRMAWLTFEHNFSKFRVSIEILNDKKTYFELKNNLINLRGKRTYKNVAMDFVKILDLNDWRCNTCWGKGI